jgi:GTPase SAR1 family protein
MNDSLLIIGRPASGKTTFLAQFLTRVRKKKSRIKLLKASENIKAISEAQRRLAAGKEPNTTAADSNEDLVLPLMLNNTEIQLSCPDYGGEQINSLMESMAIEPRWQKYVDGSASWLIFIRPSHISSAYDLTVSTYENIHGIKSENSLTPELSEQSQFIELVQALLYAKKVGIKNRISSPRLIIALTCWDELDTNKTPKAFLQEKMPLFLQLVESNWERSKFEIFGLSAQEFSLIDNPDGSDKYLDELPENIGYLILPDGKRDNDITKLIESALT